MNIKFGTNRLVVIGKNYVYKLPILYRGILANNMEYDYYCNNIDIVAHTQKYWYGLKQERLTNLRTYRRYAKLTEIPDELHELFNKKLHNRMQVGLDKFGKWRYFDYEDIKFYLRDEIEPM